MRLLPLSVRTGLSPAIGTAIRNRVHSVHRLITGTAVAAAWTLTLAAGPAGAAGEAAQ